MSVTLTVSDQYKYKVEVQSKHNKKLTLLANMVVQS